MASETTSISSKQENFNAVFDLTAILSAVIAIPSTIIWGITKKKAFLYIAIGIIGFLVLLLIYENIFLGNKSGDSSSFPSNPKDGDIFVKDGVKYTFTCAKTPTVTVNQPCNGSWKTGKQIEEENMIQRQSFAAGGTVGSAINCHETKIIDGIKRTLTWVWKGNGHDGPEGYFASWSDLQTNTNKNLPITKQEYDNLVEKCYPLPVAWPIGFKHDCGATFKVGPGQVTYQFKTVEATNPTYGIYSALYVPISTIPVTHPPYAYSNPFKYSIEKPEYDRLSKKCLNKQTV